MKILFKNKWLLNNFTIDDKIKKAIIYDKIDVNNIVLIMDKNNNLIEYIYNNCDLPKIILDFLKTVFYFTNNKFLEKDLYIEFNKLSILIDKLIKNVNNIKKYNNIFISNCFLYETSYININKKNILVKYNKLLCKLFDFNKLPIVKKTFNKKIKILVIGFFLISAKTNTITSVFRDRSEILKKLDSNIFSKDILLHDNKNNENIYKYFIKKFDNVFYFKKTNLEDMNKNVNKIVNNLKKNNYDIVIYPSIGMDVHNNIFANYRIAPIQITTWGHSITSGIDTIDYYISSKLYELPYKKSKNFYSEKLLLLNNMTTYYPKYINISNKKMKTRKELNLPENKYILFCMQNIVKINLDFLNMLQKIILKESNILIIFSRCNISDDKIKYINNILQNKAIFMNNLSFFNFNNHICVSDLVLDTFPFGGCNSSIESLSFGKIVITRPSKYLPGRFTYGFYKKMGITEPIVNNYNEYIDKVIYYLHNIEERNKLEKIIKEKSKCLYEEQESFDEWQQMLIDLYKKHIDKNINIKKLLEKKYINPLQLLHSNRYDIIFKYIYIKYANIYKFFGNWTSELYKQHIQLLNGGYEMITSVQNKQKNSVKDFFIDFQNIINIFIKNQYIEHPLPLYDTNNILNGSHRTACHIFYNKKLLYKIIPNSKPFKCHSEFFKNRELNKNNLPLPGKDIINNVDKKYMDFSILEYILLKKDVRILCMYSNNYNNYQQKILQYIFSTNTNIVYAKTITMTDIGLYNFIKEAYLTETFVNVTNKTNATKANYNNNNYTITVYVLENNLSEYSKSGGKHKTELRKIFNNHNAVHISDNNDDTIRMAKIIFNENTLKFYNTIKHDYDNNTIKLFNNYTNMIKNNDNYCIVSSYILNLYKLRKAKDIDYIHNDIELIIPSHNHLKKHYNDTILNLIYNPDNYFYFHGYKCMNLELVKTFKLNRNEIPKDIDDILLIDNMNINKNNNNITKNNNNMNKNNDIFISNNIYKNFNHKLYPNDLQALGNSFCGIFNDCIKYLKPKLILELGSWKGASANNMANLTKQYNLNSKIICVDTWLGTIINYLSETNSKIGLTTTNGYPNIYYYFLANVIYNNNKDIIYPIPNTTSNAFKIIKKKNIKINMIYIDASHEYNDVYNDLNNSWDILVDNGIIIGDDIDRIGIIKALDKFIYEKNIKLYLYKESNKYLIYKNKNYNIPNLIEIKCHYNKIYSIMNKIIYSPNINNNYEKFNLFQNFKKVDFKLEPYPHIVINNALPKTIYNKLYNEFPSNIFFNDNKMRYNNCPIFKNCDEILKNNNISDIWKQFIDYQSSPEFFEQFIKIFKNEIVKYYGHIININDLNKNNCCKRNNGKKNIILDSQIRINTPVSRKSSIISAHCDNPFKLYVGLYYMPINDDNAGGDLHLYEMKDKNINISSIEKKRFIDSKYLNISKIIKYKPNTFVLFLNTIKSIHGVEPRNITTNIRRLCTFSASYNKQLFNMYNVKED